MEEKIDFQVPVFPFNLTSQDGQALLIAYSNIYPNNGVPRFNKTYWDSEVKVCNTIFPHCIEMHPMMDNPSTCVFTLPAGSIRIKCKFGMAKQNTKPDASGDFTGTILVNGNIIWSGNVKGTTCAAQLHDIDILFTGVPPFTQIEFKVNPNGRYEADHAVWLAPTLYNV